MFRYDKEQLLQLKYYLDSLREIEYPKIEPLTDILLKQLINRVKDNIKHFPNQTLDNAVFGEYYPDACGCLGARDGELYCNCRMNMLRYHYRYDIALKILDEFE